MSVWFVTGASRGFGAEITREALDRGHRVIATARDMSAVLRAYPEKPAGLLSVSADVTEPEQLTVAVEAGLAEFGRIDVVVNNAGYGLVGAIEETSDTAARALFDVNVFGVLNTLRATLPTLRAQRSGHILNISSVGGFATAPAVGLYGASKFALEGISEALHGELAPLGVRVTIVEPGGFRTDFLNGSSIQVEPAAIEDYAAGAGPVREALAQNDGRQPGDPVKAAKAIVDITEVDEPPLRLQLGADAVERVEAKLDLVRRELDEWRHVALSTAI
ncbi:short-chain dehydrogenase/reductase [Streptomyces spinoverrucosus]|uniref:Short-chain dehydrogenase/reductase n=1 Tax=Streptomyces spinoverrucosus TaxID=284043 RepID=A0A4Y3VRT1_9ACTN|nr:oxidoreductase [Streptomyces spinoverrucosus]GEC08735.1 short-chain dehydrogenase/reductase [Streptomyces spinoverrucosus]GHB64207.1 short-chain dehydrogenase/reductase [Streptomyces spinoverrucosus]